jgi:hypothetical protein
LLAAVEEPALGAGLLYRNFTGGECFKVAGLGAECEANLTGDGVPAGSMFHATASSTKRFAAGVAFEVNA